PASSAAHCSGACSTSGCSIGALSFELTEEAFTGSVIAVMPDGTHVAACNRKRPNLQSAPFLTDIICDYPALQSRIKCE
ncbi:hypothetical protein AAA542_34085, partial [Pseudomonas aeruginosa]